jgi:MFS family permease
LSVFKEETTFGCFLFFFSLVSVIIYIGPSCLLPQSLNLLDSITAGCFFGAILASVANDKLGRKRSLLGFTVVFLVGAVIQVASLHHISQVYVGRFVAGLGIGGMSSITPIYVAENCPPEVRGRITGLFQEFLVIGSTFAYWLNYGVSLHLKPSTSQWRIPVSIRSEFLV